MKAGTNFEIRDFRKEDFPEVRRIYQDGIDTGIATFETQAPNWETWNKKFLPQPRLVSNKDNLISGWIALSRVSTRKVYAGVCEVTLYIHKDYRGLGIGKALLGRMISESESRGIWTLQAGIFPENRTSIKIHKELGFRELGLREKIGKRDGVWKDNVFLERRSKIAGMD